MVFFFFNDTATTEIYTLSLHDALPIWVEPGLYGVDAAQDHDARQVDVGVGPQAAFGTQVFEKAAPEFLVALAALDLALAHLVGQLAQQPAVGQGEVAMQIGRAHV